MSAPRISVVICTYNRAFFLREVLSSLSGQITSRKDWEIIVINNNSQDETEKVGEEYSNEALPVQFRMIKEEKQGLSHARNTGYTVAEAEWVFYLDDDAKASPNLVERLFWLIENEPYEVVGGVYLPWYHYGRPRWFKDKYGSNAKSLKELTILNAPDAVSGGVMLWRKQLLLDLNGFDPKLGMNGSTLAYGEETYLQEKARARGVKIAYDPELIIYHVVMSQKLQLDWFFKSYFAGGRDAVLSGSIKTSFFAILTQLLIGVLVMIKDFFIYTPKLLRKDYYLENWLIDVFRKFAKRLGSVYTALLLNRP